MSVEQMGPYKMPQPEQWLSEHLWASLAILAACVASLVWWLA